MRGLPGSGKSTWAKKQDADVIVSADDWFMRSGEYKFNPAELPAAHDACLSRFLDAIQHGTRYVIVDNTNLKVWEIAPYYRLAQLFGYAVSIACMDTLLSTCLKRNTHKVPDVKMGQMYQILLSEVLPDHWMTFLVSGSVV